MKIHGVEWKVGYIWRKTYKDKSDAFFFHRLASLLSSKHPSSSPSYLKLDHPCVSNDFQLDWSLLCLPSSRLRPEWQLAGGLSAVGESRIDRATQGVVHKYIRTLHPNRNFFPFLLFHLLPIPLGLGRHRGILQAFCLFPSTRSIILFPVALSGWHCNTTKTCFAQKLGRGDVPDIPPKFSYVAGLLRFWPSWRSYTISKPLAPFGILLPLKKR